MTDTKETIYCPACGKEMIKIYDPNLKINVDVCANGCGGIYFDDKEYEIFRDASGNIEDSLNFIMTSNPQVVDEREFRTCPSCKSVMAKTYMGKINRVQIDKCMGCGGVFLDYGELSTLRNQK